MASHIDYVNTHQSIRRKQRGQMLIEFMMILPLFALMLIWAGHAHQELLRSQEQNRFAEPQDTADPALSVEVTSLKPQDYERLMKQAVPSQRHNYRTKIFNQHEQPQAF